MRKTVLIGNGLGMALDSAHFDLSVAMQSVWKDAGALSPTHRDLISACLPNQSPNGPSSEEDLRLLQEVTAACILLKSVPTTKYHWLSGHGISFPESVHAFTNLVATRICDFDPWTCSNPNWKKFSQQLARFMIENAPHIATLNYDNLIFDLITSESRLKTLYKDGFESGRFTRSNLIRGPQEKNCAFFLKLHGSPFFYTAADNSIRMGRGSASASHNNQSSHLVLSHISKKEVLIEKSNVLDSYWDMLQVAIRQSEEIIIFGYSGNDMHLNHLFRQHPSIRKRVVEWLGVGRQKVRKTFWDEMLGDHVEYLPMEDVLDFEDW